MNVRPRTTFHERKALHVEQRRRDRLIQIIRGTNLGNLSRLPTDCLTILAVACLHVQDIERHRVTQARSEATEQEQPK